MWIPENFNEKTADMPINSSWQLTVAGRYTNFIQWTVPQDTVVLLGRYNRLLMRLYTAGGVLLSERAPLMVRFKKPTDRLWKEVCQIANLGTWIDLTWLEQMSNKNKDVCVYDLGHPFLLAYSGEMIGIAVNLPSEVLPASPHASSKFKHPYFYMTRERFDTLRRVKTLRLPDFVKTGDVIE